MTTLRRPRQLLAAGLTTLAVFATTTAPAHADHVTRAQQAMEPAEAGELRQRQLTVGHTTLTEQLMADTARRSGTNLDAFAATNGLKLPDGRTPGSFADVQNQLTGVRTATAADGLQDLEAVRDQMSAQYTMDGVATSAGVSLATNLAAQLDIPELEVPALDVSALSLQAAPEEALTFGLFYKDSVTNLVANSPGVLDEVRKSGLSDPAAQAAWDDAMADTLTQTLNSDPTGVMPAPCHAAMLAAAASGSGAFADRFNDDGSATAAGLFLNYQWDYLMDPEKNSAYWEPGFENLSVVEWDALDEFEQQQWIESSPEAQEAIEEGTQRRENRPSNSEFEDCSTADTAAKSVAEDRLPRTLELLNR